MNRLLAIWHGAFSPKRAVRCRPLGVYADTCETRTLLSGTAVFPLPAVVSTVEVAANVPVAALAPPADFSGSWNITKTPPGSAGVMVISQNGNKLEISLGVEGFNLPSTGKVKGETAKAKIVNGTVMGFSAKGKFRMMKTGKNLMSGEVNLKVKGNGKMSFSITGVRVI